MLDLETSSSRSDAAIRSIALYAFDPYGVEPSEPDPARLFYRNTIDTLGRVDPDTLRWWDEQPEYARAALETPEPIVVNDALDDLVDWVQLYASKHGDPLIWSHATFDPPILTFAFAVRRRTFPFPFRNYRDIRTVQGLAGVTYADVGPKENEHIAAWDVWYQARVVQACYHELFRDRSL